MRRTKNKNTINIGKTVISRNIDNTKTKDERVGNNYKPTIEMFTGTFVNPKKKAEKEKRKKQKEILKKEYKAQKAQKALKADKLKAYKNQSS